MNESRYWFLTGKYLSKSLTEEEKAELENYISASDSNRALFENHVRIWESFSSYQKEVDFDSKTSWNELKALIAESDMRRSRVRFIRTWHGVAAACIIALITLVIIQRGSDTVTYTTTDTKQLFILPDSSKVWLNKNSQLSYKPKFAVINREVKLVGEAYFEVQHDPQHPFIIFSQHTFTRVLGTKFNVSSYDSDSAIIVSVVQGKVQFGSRKTEDEALILTKDFSGTYLKYTKGLQKSTTADANVLAWQTGRLVFLNSPMPYLVDQLEDLYNIRIEIQSPEIMDCSFSGTFDHLDFGEVTKILGYTMNLDFTKDGESHYILTGSSCLD